MIREGEELRDQGLNQAVSHAEVVDPGWKDRAWEQFVKWIQSKPTGYFFLIEDFRRICEKENLIEQPPSKRAFGFLSVKGAKAGLIRQNGTAKVKNSTAHRANAALWIVK